MNILFTKKLDEKEVSKILGAEFSSHYLEVIKINLLDLAPFPLGNKSLIFTSVNGVESFFKNGFKLSKLLPCVNASIAITSNNKIATKCLIIFLFIN